MKYIIETDNLNFSYKNKEVFRNLSLKIKEGSFTTILGLNGSGKTTLIKLILGLLKGNCVVMCQGVPVSESNLKVLRKETGVVFENASDYFVAETVMDEIAFTLENLNLSKEEIKEKINYVANKLNLKKILEIEPYKLNAEDRWTVALASALVMNPKILLIDNGFNDLSFKRKNFILKVLKEFKDMTIISTTSNCEEVLYGDEVIVLNGGKVLASGSKREVFDDLVLLEEAGFSLPFIVSLSEKLKYYDLTLETYFSAEKLVDDLWK